MRIRIKKKGTLGYKRTDAVGRIDDILVKENLISPEKENIHIYFRGRDSSGILNLSKNEAQALINSMKPIMGLVRKSKTIK